MRPLARITTILLVAGLTLGACSSGADTDDDPETAAVTTTTQVAASDGEDMDAFCAGFAELATGRDPQDRGQLDLGDGSPEAVAEAYANQLETVEEIAAVAPDEIQEQADTYIEVIIARAEFAAGTAGTDLTQEERIEFGRSRAAQQLQVNELLEYARQECPDFE